MQNERIYLRSKKRPYSMVKFLNSFYANNTIIKATLR